jgi:hypothetical protein
VLGSQRSQAELTEQFLFRGGVKAKIRSAANISEAQSPPTARSRKKLVSCRPLSGCCAAIRFLQMTITPRQCWAIGRSIASAYPLPANSASRRRKKAVPGIQPDLVGPCVGGGRPLHCRSRQPNVYGDEGKAVGFSRPTALLSYGSHFRGLLARRPTTFPARAFGETSPKHIGTVVSEQRRPET